MGAIRLGFFFLFLSQSGVVLAYGDPPLAARMTSACEAHLTGAALEAAQAKWQGKVVILDTNVLLNDPYAVFKYPGAKLIIPGTVFEELDNKKDDLQTGKAAREFSRIIDDLLKSGQNLYKGVELGNGTVLAIDNRDLTFVLDDTTLDRKKKDNEIVALAVWYTNDQPKYGSVVLVSDDRNVRIKASSEEVLAMPFEYDWVVSPKKIEKEYGDLIVSDLEFKQFLTTGVLPRAPGSGLRPNEFVMVRTAGGEGCPDCLARYVFYRERPEMSRLRRVPDFGDLPAPPRNLEQRMLFDLLFDPSVHLVIVEAQAGTGKTFVTMEAALLQRPGAPGKFSGRYEEVTITKPMASMGREGLGTLPGGASEKMSEKFKSFYDNLKVLVKMMNGGKSSQKEGKGRHFVSVPNLEIAPLPEVRGRSFHDTLLVIDEFQNTNLHEAKTILTRAASGTKIVVLGNAAQIDVPYLNELNNGLSIAATVFTDPSLSDAERSLVGFVRLKEGERSELTDLANKVYSQPLPVR